MDAELMAYLGILVVLLFMLVICIRMIKITTKARRDSKNKLAESMREIGATDVSDFVHVDGLGLPDGVICQIFTCPDAFVMQRNEMRFRLLYSRIIDATCKTETELQTNYVSSVGGAIGGAYLFGPVGAMIGGRAKKKQDRTVHRYLIFAYDKEGATKFLTFDCTNNVLQAQKVLQAYDANRSRQVRNVDL